MVALADLKGRGGGEAVGTRDPLAIQFPNGFQQKILPNNSFCPKLRGWHPTLGDPGSVTGLEVNFWKLEEGLNKVHPPLSFGFD